MADIFLSYSRRDSGFVSRLVDGLEQRGKQVWIDIEGVRDAEVFPDALRRAIDASDAFVFVISPDSVGSDFCQDEIARAAAQNKRIVPLALAEVDPASVPEAIRLRNWIPAGDGTDLASTLDRVVAALDTDLEWDRQHARMTVRALEWDEAGRDRSFLLRGSDLAGAERWFAAGAGKQPGPTAIEGEYLATARAAAARRQRGVLLASVGVAAVSLALLVFALISRSDAVSARNAARAQALTSDAERVGALALSEPSLDRSLLEAVAAVRLQNRVETRSDLMSVLQHNPALIHFDRPFTGLLTALQVSPDGRLLAVASASGVVRLIDLGTFQRLGADVDLPDPVAPRALSFAPDGRTLMAVTVSGAQATLEEIDVASRRARRVASWSGSVPAPPVGSDGVAVSPDGRSIAVSAIRQSPTAERLFLLDARTGRMRWQRAYPIRPGQAEPYVVFLPDGRLLTSAQQGDTLLWDTRRGRIIRSFPVGGLPAASSNGRTVALGMNSPFAGAPSATVAVVDTSTGRFRVLMTNLPTAWIRGIAFASGDTQIVADAFDGVHVWSIDSGRITESFAGLPGTRSVMAADPTRSEAFVGFQDGSVAEFDISGQRRLERPFTWDVPTLDCAGNGPGPCDAVNRQSTLLVDTRSDGTLAIIDLARKQLIRKLPGRGGPNADAVSFLPDGRTVVDGGLNGRVTAWNADTGAVEWELRFDAPVQLVAPSPDGTTLAVETQAASSPKSRIEVVRIPAGHIVRTYTLPAGSVGLGFTPDGRQLIALGCCNPGSVLVGWDTRTGRRRFSDAIDVAAGAVAIAPDTGWVGVATQDGKVLFFNPRTGRRAARPLQASAGNIFYLAFSPDGRNLSESGADNSVTVWDLRSRTRLGSPFGPYQGTLPPTLFEPNGRLLVILLEQAIEWPMSTDTWMRFACGVVARDLTRAEWHALLPARPYERVCSG